MKHHVGHHSMDGKDGHKRIKHFGHSGGHKIGGGANKKAGSLIASPNKDMMISKRGK